MGTRTGARSQAVGAFDIIDVRCHTGPLKATLLVRTRIVYADNVFAEIVVWEVPQALAGWVHTYKYRLALVADGICVLRYDNESGKGDHRHTSNAETRYRFVSLDKLFADFERGSRRFIDENRDA
jgi:Family of unknown function (DUF6516)